LVYETTRRGINPITSYATAEPFELLKTLVSSVNGKQKIFPRCDASLN